MFFFQIQELFIYITLTGYIQFQKLTPVVLPRYPLHLSGEQYIIEEFLGSGTPPFV